MYAWLLYTAIELFTMSVILLLLLLLLQLYRMQTSMDTPLAIVRVKLSSSYFIFW